MKSIHLIFPSTAAIVLVGIAALADDSKSEESPAEKAPAKFTNSTPTPAQWDLPSTHRLFVSKKTVSYTHLRAHETPEHLVLRGLR